MYTKSITNQLHVLHTICIEILPTRRNVPLLNWTRRRVRSAITPSTSKRSGCSLLVLRRRKVLENQASKAMQAKKRRNYSGAKMQDSVVFSFNFYPTSVDRCRESRRVTGLQIRPRTEGLWYFTMIYSQFLSFLTSLSTCSRFRAANVNCRCSRPYYSPRLQFIYWLSTVQFITRRSIKCTSLDTAKMRPALQLQVWGQESFKSPN